MYLQARKAFPQATRLRFFEKKKKEKKCIVITIAKTGSKT